MRGRLAMSSSSSAPLRTLRHRITAPTRNSTATTALTTASGSRVSRLPASTAISDWTAKASPTPMNTGSGLNRVASTRVANSVLSGSSTGSTRMNAAAMTDRTTRIPLPLGSCRAGAGSPRPAARLQQSKVSPIPPGRGPADRAPEGRQHVDQRTGGYSPSAEG